MKYMFECFDFIKEFTTNCVSIVTFSEGEPPSAFITVTVMMKRLKWWRGWSDEEDDEHLSSSRVHQLPPSVTSGTGSIDGAAQLSVVQGPVLGVVWAVPGF